MNADLPRKPHCIGRVVVSSLTVLGVVAGAALISACSQQSDNQTAQQQQQQAARSRLLDQPNIRQ
jgi:ABC transporter substrate binding protein